jgi:hypothetical protein
LGCFAPLLGCFETFRNIGVMNYICGYFSLGGSSSGVGASMCETYIHGSVVGRLSSLVTFHGGLIAAGHFASFSCASFSRLCGFFVIHLARLIVCVLCMVLGVAFGALRRCSCTGVLVRIGNR